MAAAETLVTVAPTGAEHAKADVPQLPAQRPPMAPDTARATLVVRANG
jgi:uncharacterized protein (DUF849 family)